MPANLLVTQAPRTNRAFPVSDHCLSAIRGLLRPGFARCGEKIAKAIGRRSRRPHSGCSWQPGRFFFRTTNVTGEVNLAADIEMVIPGDNAAISVSLDKPVALDIGSRFAIREGGKTVGSGVITEVVE
jgi:hypothetical protein